MNIVAGGDSFIWGTELQDCLHNGINGHSKKTFPSLLAADHQYVCAAFPGNSNDAIARNIINYCENNKAEDLFVVVCWTFNGRYEFRINDKWEVINSWSTGKMYRNSEDKEEEKQNFLVKVFEAKAKQKGIHDFAKIYFDQVGWSEYWESYTTIKEIVYLQNYLKVNSIPYMFTCINNEFHNHTIKSNDVTIQSVFGQIDFDKWYFFPPATEEWNTTVPRGFYQWAVENKYKCGPVHHPLEQAHQDAAMLMQGKFNELVKKSL